MSIDSKLLYGPDGKPLPRHSQSNFIELMFDQPAYRELMGKYNRKWIESPFLTTSRVSALGLLYILWNNLKPDEPLITLDNRDLAIAGMNWLVPRLGLAYGQELMQLASGMPIPLIDPSYRCKTYDELVKQSPSWKGKVAGIFHGAIDPPNAGHASAIMALRAYCDILLVGFDSSQILAMRKGSGHPRYPELAWRMYEIANMPAIGVKDVTGLDVTYDTSEDPAGYVFVMPVTPANYTNEAYERIYQELGVQVMACGTNNSLLPEYEARMQRLGGHVVKVNPLYSSTKLHNLITSGRTGWPEADIHELAGLIQEEDAFKAGFPRDFPNGT